MKSFARLATATGITALVVMAVAGCRPDDQRTDTLDPQGDQTRAQLPAPVVAQLDSGNVAYRAEDFDLALVHFRRAAEIGPDLAAPWFGVYMVQHKLGNAAAADSAYRRAQSAAPGATLIHPTPTDTLGTSGSGLAHSSGASR